MAASPSLRRWLFGWRKPLHIDHFAVARAIEVGKPRLLDETHALIEAARRRVAIGRGSIDIDVLGAGLAHGGFGAGINMSAEPPALLLGRNYDPVKIEGALRALDQPVAGVSDKPRPTLGEHEVVAGADALGEALGHEIGGDIDLCAREHARVCH